MTGFPIIVADVYMDDGATYVATIDQRDQHRALMPPALGGAGISSPDLDQIGFMRGMAWASLTRLGVLDIGYAEFDATCIGAQPRVDELDGGDQVDPT